MLPLVDDTRGSDRSERWRSSYLDVRKDLLRSTDSTNRARLRQLGGNRLVPGARWLDVGAGDGNVVRSLTELAELDVIAIEPQLELLRRFPTESPRAAGSALALPVASQSIDGIVLMDVLHHLPPGCWREALCEARRVLRDGGALLVCEPAATRTRRWLSSLLLGPAGGLTRFSNHKRVMVLEEADTLFPWLEVEHCFAGLAHLEGFTLEWSRRGLLHASYRFVADVASS
jgi:ubiquinone/menaquinone biosynthesis C-methylase UbiE